MNTNSREILRGCADIAAQPGMKKTQILLLDFCQIWRGCNWLITSIISPVPTALPSRDLGALFFHSLHFLRLAIKKGLPLQQSVCRHFTIFFRFFFHESNGLFICFDLELTRVDERVEQILLVNTYKSVIIKRTMVKI